MRIEYLLSVIYLVFSYWIIPKISFVRHADLTAREIRFLFAFKILSAVVCAFYFKSISGNVDYLGYNEEGENQYRLLLSDPALFFTDFKVNMHTYGPGGLFESKDSFWAYLRFNLLHKLIAVFDLITHGNFYFNTCIFSSLVFFGHIAFYRVYSQLYKRHKLELLFVCFFLPSLILYTSCVHKDGIVFLGTGILSFILYIFLTRPHSLTLKSALLFLVAIGTIFLLRNYVFLALIPAMAIAVLGKALPYSRKLIFTVSYFFFFLLFFLSGYTSSFFNMPAIVVQRKADFALLGEATTNIPMNNLYPDIKSFILNLPQAVNHFLFRPYLWEFSKPTIIFTAVELFFYQLMIVSFIFFRKKQVLPTHNFNLFGFAFFINMMLIIGYTIPNIGALVRYRSVFWVFLLSPLVCNTDWIRLFPFGASRLQRSRLKI